MRVLLLGLTIAVLFGVPTEVSADGGHGHGPRHGHGHGHGHGHDDHDHDDDDRDHDETWIFLGSQGFQGGSGWGSVPQGCRVERRWDEDGDYRERVDCRGPSHSNGWTSVPLIRAPSLNIVIPIN